MKSPARFLIGKHQMDLLSIAVNTPGAAGGVPLICMTEGRGMAAMALGHESAATIRVCPAFRSEMPET